MKAGVDIGAEVTDKTKALILEKEAKLRTALRDQEAFPLLRDSGAMEKEREILKDIFNRIIGTPNSIQAQEFMTALIGNYKISKVNLSISNERAKEILDFVLRGEIDKPQQDYSSADRVMVYETLFTNAKIWQNPYSENEFLDFKGLTSKIREKYFGRPGSIPEEISFYENVHDFAKEVIR
jgi:hypothetical protein